jgi:hypothetical protein
LSHTNGQGMTQRAIDQGRYSALVSNGKGFSRDEDLQQAFPNSPFWSTANDQTPIDDEDRRNFFVDETQTRGFLSFSVAQRLGGAAENEVGPAGNSRGTTIADRDARGPTAATLPYDIQTQGTVPIEQTNVNAGSSRDSAPGPGATIPNDVERLRNGANRTRSSNLSTGYQMGISGGTGA